MGSVDGIGGTLSTAISRRILGSQFGQQLSAALLHGLVAAQPAHKELDVHGEAGIIVTFPVKGKFQRLLNDVGHFVQHLNGCQGGVEITAFQLGIDDMERNADRFGTGEDAAGAQTDGLQRLQAQLVFPWVKLPYIITEGDGKLDALLLPLLCKGNVVCKGKGEIGIQFGIQKDFGLLCNVCTGQQSGFRQTGKDLGSTS